MEHRTKIIYSIVGRDEKFKNYDHRKSTQDERLEKLAEELNKKGWECRMSKRFDHPNSSYQYYSGEVLEDINNPFGKVRVAKIEAGEIIVLGEESRINQFLMNYNPRLKEEK